MTAKQLSGSFAPDGSQYITLTDGAGNLLSVSGGGGSGITVGTTTITSGTSGRVLYDNAGVVGEIANTGTGSNVLATSPTLVTPTLGAATATTINGNTITTGTGTLTLGTAKVATINNTLTLAGTDSTTITFQGTDTYIGRATTDTLTNKTYDTAGTGNSFSINGVAATANTGTGSVVRATSPTLVTPVLGVATGTSLANTGTITSSDPAAGIGYATGAGGTVTQITSKSTAVTLNKICGQIITHNASLTNNTNVSFTLNNTSIGVNDVVLVAGAGTSTSTYIFSVAKVAANSCVINIFNIGSTQAEALTINFVVIKSVIS